MERLRERIMKAIEFKLDEKRDFMRCPRCKGQGKIFDPIKIGQKARDFRKNQGIKLSLLGQEMHLSKGYLSDLELGRRGWGMGFLFRYLSAINRLIPPPPKILKKKKENGL